MDRTGRNEVDLAGLEYDWRLAIDLVFHQAFEDIDDLFARMRVPGGRHAGVYVNAHLDGLASGGSEVLLLKIGAADRRLGLTWRLLRQSGGGDGESCQSDCGDSACEDVFLFHYSNLLLAAEPVKQRRGEVDERDDEAAIIRRGRIWG